MEVPQPPAGGFWEEGFRSSFGYPARVDHRPKVPRAARLFAPEERQTSQKGAGMTDLMTGLMPFRNRGEAGRTAMAPIETARGDVFPH